MLLYNALVHLRHFKITQPIPYVIVRTERNVLLLIVSVQTIVKILARSMQLAVNSFDNNHLTRTRLPLLNHI